MELYTERLKLIPLKEEDIKMSLKNVNEFYHSKGLKSNTKTLSDVMVKIYNIKLANMKDDPKHYLFYTYWLIVKKDSNEIIGRIGFKNIPDENSEIEIGYGTRIEYRSNGYMTEALESLTDWGFKQTILPIQTIVAKTKRDNIPSQRVLFKTGFKFKSEKDGLLCWKLDKKS